MNSLWDFVDYEIFVGSLFELKIFSSNFLERNSLRLIIFFFFFRRNLETKGFIINGRFS